MENLILIVILVLIIGGASVYIRRAKKKGQKCIGCPYAKTCNSCCCNSSFEEDK